VAAGAAQGQAPARGAEQVFRYLGRYTHRVAISNHRIVAVAGGTVTFTVKDYTDGARTNFGTCQNRPGSARQK
jgi:hypothetical protein